MLLLLAAGDPGERDWRRITPVPGKLFIVGDPKQAIYRFRRADFETYREVCELLESRGARAFLHTSFRATPAIQRAVNAAFAPLMTGDRATLQAQYVCAVAVPRRHTRPAVGQADTITQVLNATRAHVGFVRRAAGEQSLANVLHVAELAGTR